MYDELVKELRDSAEWADRLALLMGRAEGDAHAPVMRQAADAIEELSNDYEKLAEDFNGAVELLHKRSKPRWIPVTERLPAAERKHYWVCTNTGYQCECRWTNNLFGLGESGEWGWSIFDIPQYQKVVAWMPLPEPYEPQKEQAE